MKPNSLVIGSFISVLSGGYYSRFKFETYYTQNSTLLDVL